MPEKRKQDRSRTLARQNKIFRQYLHVVAPQFRVDWSNLYTLATGKPGGRYESPFRRFQRAMHDWWPEAPRSALDCFVDLDEITPDEDLLEPLVGPRGWRHPFRNEDDPAREETEGLALSQRLWDARRDALGLPRVHDRDRLDIGSYHSVWNGGTGSMMFEDTLAAIPLDEFSTQAEVVSAFNRFRDLLDAYGERVLPPHRKVSQKKESFIDAAVVEGCPAWRGLEDPDHPGRQGRYAAILSALYLRNVLELDNVAIEARLWPKTDSNPKRVERLLARGDEELATLDHGPEPSEIDRKVPEPGT